jgi:hypothetical protein
LSEETVVVICPNPKCRREIQEPILLAILSATPPKKFKACPYCFTELTPEPEIEKEDVPEPAVEDEEVLAEIEENVDITDSETSGLEKVKSGPSFLQRVKSLIPGRSNDAQKEVEELQDEADSIEEEMVTEEELKPEPKAVEEPEEVPTAESLVEDEPEEVEETEELEEAEEAKELEEPEELEEAPTIEEPETKEVESSGCPEEFGYLANRPPDTPIPSRCLICPKMVDCMLSPRDE